MDGSLSRVSIQFRKWWGAPHWHYEATRLGSDTHGTWLGILPGTKARRGAEPPISFRRPSVKLVPDNAWWVANFNAPGGEFLVYIDISTSTEWAGDVLRLVDLDLDVVRFADGSVALLDQDEFDDHRVRYGYPSEVVESANSAAAWLVGEIRARREPFDGVAAAWLEQFTTISPL